MTSPLAGRRVLVVDDERAIAAAVVRRLEQDGAVCVAAYSGTEGAARLSGDAFDLVVTDIEMPGKSGLDLLADVRVLRERRAHHGTESGDDVDDSFRQARVVEGAHEIEGGERRILRGLDDAGVAADHRGQQFPRRDGHREVPGRDHAADADGLAHGHGKLVGHFRRDRGAEEASAFASVVVGGVDGFLHVAAGFGEDLAHLAGHFLGIVFLALDEDFGGAENNLSPAGRRDETPLGEGALGGVDGGVDVVFVRFLEDADQVAGVGGIAVFEGLAARGPDPLAVDEILEDLGAAVVDRGRGCKGIGCHDVSLRLPNDDCRLTIAAQGRAPAVS